jgi:hypothetical protein
MPNVVAWLCPATIQIRVVTIAPCAVQPAFDSLGDPATPVLSAGDDWPQLSSKTAAVAANQFHPLDTISNPKKHFQCFFKMSRHLNALLLASNARDRRSGLSIRSSAV